MNAEQWADEIYDATGLVANAEQAMAIGNMITNARITALDKAWWVIASRPVNEDGLTYFELMNRDQEMMSEIADLKRSGHV